MNTNSALRRGVVAVIGRPEDERLLVIRRSQFVVAPGAFCFPGGALEEGESEEVALKRELLEELSVEIEIHARVWECVTPWNVHLAWWTASLVPRHTVPVPSPHEVEEFSWRSPAEILTLPGLLASNIDFLTSHWLRPS